MSLQQRSLWEPYSEEPLGESVRACSKSAKYDDVVHLCQIPTLTPRDIDTMRSWLLAWGERHNYPGFGFPFHYPPRNEDEDRRFGSIYHGKAGWIADTQPPYHQREVYPGEWLQKAIEQCQRFDAGIQSIPWQIYYENDHTPYEDWE